MSLARALPFLLPLLVAAASASPALAQTGNPPSAAQNDACSPVQENPGTGVYFAEPSETCRASLFPAADDVPQIIDETGAVPDSYVLAADLVRDDASRELLILVLPWSDENFLVAMGTVQVLRDGDLDGHTWQPAPTSQAPTSQTPTTQ